MDFQMLILQFLGGLGLFLFAIKYIGDGLQKVAGNRLRKFLDKFTTNPILGVLVGAIVTGIIQSSTATTVIIISLVNARLMTLRQSIGVIMGANIGTTIKAFTVGFDVGAYAYVLMAIGGLLLFLSKEENIRYIGQVIFGLAGIFIGIDLLGSSMAPLANRDFLYQANINFNEYPVFGVIAGVILTVIIQSSSASIGILQEIYDEGLISLSSALTILFGDNIGTNRRVTGLDVLARVAEGLPLRAGSRWTTSACTATLDDIFLQLTGRHAVDTQKEPSRDLVQDSRALTIRNLCTSAQPRAAARRHMQPIMFTVLFVYVFGGTIPVEGGYRTS